jgi:hypothetical protein
MGYGRLPKLTENQQHIADEKGNISHLKANLLWMIRPQ